MIKKLVFISSFILLIIGCASDNKSVNGSSGNNSGGIVEEVKIDITFNGNGADSGSMESLQVTKGSTVTIPENQFVKDGYNFLGWSDTLNGEVIYSNNASFKADNNITLFAVWKLIDTSATYKVTLHSNYDDNITVNYFTYGTTFILPNTPYLNGSKGFLGWATSENGKVEYYNQQSIKVQSNLDLYAVWTEDNPKASYSITINNQETSYNCSNINEERVYGDKVYIEYRQCERNDYVFLGWAETGSNQVIYRDGDVITVTRDLSLEPVWANANDVYTVTFNEGQGRIVGGPKVLYVKKGDGFILPESDYYKRDNFIPAGYSTLSDSDDNYIEPLHQFVPESNTELFVVWKDGSNKDYANQTRWVYGLNMDNAYWMENNGIKTAYRNDDDNWYDIYQGSNELCWSASSSNMILWWYKNNKYYVDKYNAEIGYTLPEFSYYIKNSEGYSPIFEIYRRNLDSDKGSQPTIALNYFILGNSAIKEGAYFKQVFNNTILAKTEIASDKAKFNHIMNTVFNDKKIISLETYAPGPHIITIWGADYDNNGFINRIYVTDSATYNDESNGKWGNMVSADIIYIDDKAHIRYAGYSDYKLNRMHTFSLGQDIWEQYFNNIK